MCYLQLFYTFFKIGCFTLGGGYAMLSLIRRSVVKQHGWLTDEAFSEMLALAQAAPGPIAINTAVFVGYKIKGIWGGIITALGVIIPSFLIIVLVAVFFADYGDNEVVARIFKGIRPAVVGLIAAPLIHMSRTSGIGWRNVVFPLAAAFLVWWVGLSPVYIISATIVVSMFIKSPEERRNG